MQNELMAYNRGYLDVPRNEKSVAARAKKVYDDVRVEALKVSGTMMLGAHIMEETKQLDAYRQKLAGDDIGLDMLLTEIEAVTIVKALELQRRCFR